MLNCGMSAATAHTQTGQKKLHHERLTIDQKQFDEVNEHNRPV